MSVQRLLQDLEKGLEINIPYLKGLQAPDGSWPYDEKHPQNMIMTARSMEYLKLAEGISDYVEKGADFLLRQYDKGVAFISPWHEVNDIIHAAIFAYVMRQVRPDATKPIENAIRFVEDHIQDGKPVMPGTYRRQEQLGACFPALYILDGNSPKYRGLERFLFKSQRGDGGFVGKIDWGDVKYLPYRLLGGSKIELTSEFVETFLDYLGYPTDNPHIQKANDFLLTHRYLFRGRFPDVALRRANALIDANPGKNVEELPNIIDTVHGFVENPSGGISQRIHATGELVKIAAKIKSRLTS